MSTLEEIAGGLAAALTPLGKSIPRLQVRPFLDVNPSPPTVDIYPGDPFGDGAGFGDELDTQYWTVRARTGTADTEGGYRSLYRLMDRDGVTAALHSDQTLGGLVDSLGVVPEGQSGMRAYGDGNGQLLGCEWRVRVLT